MKNENKYKAKKKLKKILKFSYSNRKPVMVSTVCRTKYYRHSLYYFSQIMTYKTDGKSNIYTI